ncbi:MAG: peptidoglycan-binding protein [Hyphomonadaceae bacterium]
MIALGCVDAAVSDDQCTAYLAEVERTTRLQLSAVPDKLDKVRLSRMPPADGAMTVAQLQQALTRIGFFPGGRADGICGYRTQSAIRLFQEYVRTMENVQGFVPDGRYGPQTHEHLQRWLASGQQPDWRQRPGEYDSWLGFLERVKTARAANPGPLVEKANAFAGSSDTRKIADWDFTGPGNIHLIGLRRSEFTNKSDDIFVLLMKGLVFKFQGSTDPGRSNHAQGAPYIVPGQHDYHFGWHQSKYLALRPLSNGVLIVRSGADGRLDAADMSKELRPNATINIHWGGRGLAGNVNSWSEGCQVITGSVYINPAGELVNCTAFAAVTPDEPMEQVAKTRGAYNVLRDVVTALSGDMQNGNRVKYTLLEESDLAQSPEIQQSLTDARARVVDFAT